MEKLVENERRDLDREETWKDKNVKEQKREIMRKE